MLNHFMIWLVQKSCTDRNSNVFVSWSVQKVNRTDRKSNLFVIWLVQKQNIFGQEAEPICDLASTEGTVVRTENRTFW